MKKLIFFPSLFIAALFVSNQSSAQAAGNSVFTNPAYHSAPVNLSINNYGSDFSSLLEANVMINVKPAAYVAIFSLTQNGRTIEEVEAAMRNRTEIFKTMLKEFSGSDRDIFIDPVSMVPTYETEITEKKLSKTFNEVPVGFEMKKNVHILFHEQREINDIISIAAKAEVYDLVKVDYDIENKDAILQQLRTEAFRILVNKKAVMENSGLHARFTNVGEMQGSASPAERYVQYYAYKTGTAPYYVANYKKDKAVQTVQYNYAEKQKAVYYDMVSDKQFDKVINPVVGEPMVQVYFSLKAQYVIYDPEAEKAEKVYNDKIKQLQLAEMEANIEVKRRGDTSKVKK